jgi:hypothetical protein
MIALENQLITVRFYRYNLRNNRTIELITSGSYVRMREWILLLFFSQKYLKYNTVQIELHY